MTELERGEHEQQQHGNREDEFHHCQTALASTTSAGATLFAHESGLPALFYNSMICGPVVPPPAPGLPPASQSLRIWPYIVSFEPFGNCCRRNTQAKPFTVTVFLPLAAPVQSPSGTARTRRPKAAVPFGAG